MKWRRVDSDVTMELELAEPGIERNVVGVRIDGRDVGAGNGGRKAYERKDDRRADDAGAGQGSGFGPDGERGAGFFDAGGAGFVALPLDPRSAAPAPAPRVEDGESDGNGSPAAGR